MAINTCAAACAQNVPAFLQAGCKIKTRKAGIPFIGFTRCDYVFDDITDIAEWQAAVAANQAHILPEGVGSKAETTKVNQKLSSCRPEQFVGETHTITFRTYAVDTEDNTDYDVHNELRENIGAYRFFYIGCNGLFYLNPDYATSSPGFEVSISKWDTILAEDSNEPEYYDIELSFDFKGIVKGYDLPGVQAVLA